MDSNAFDTENRKQFCFHIEKLRLFCTKKKKKIENFFVSLIAAKKDGSRRYTANLFGYKILYYFSRNESKSIVFISINVIDHSFIDLKR